jgi:putative aminophosphonate oxidoreductase
VNDPGFRSLWLDEALGAEEPRIKASCCEGDVSVDVCIVGAGYTGLWTALELKRRAPTLDVRIVEREVAGAGASGRNGGFILSWWSKFATLRKLCGTEEARRVATASQDAIDDIRRFCEDNEIDAHFRQGGWLWTATSAAQEDVLDSAFADLATDDAVPLRRLSPGETAARSGSRVHRAGVLEPGAATVQPALLARGLRRVVLDQGIPLYERTPMTQLVAGTPATVVTPRARIRADVVVLAMNAWLARFGAVRDALVVIGSDMIATQPAADRIDEIGWVDGLGITDSRRLVHYYRTTRDGRIVFGKGGGALAYRGQVDAAFDGASNRRGEVERHFRRTYPDLHDVAIATSWTGPIDYSVTGLPFFARFPQAANVLCAAGYSGNGVGPSYLGGQVLADLVLGADTPWATSPLLTLPTSHLPPEPVRYLGGSIVRRTIATKERREDEGRRVGRLVTAISRLDPTSFVDLGTAARDKPSR